MRPGPVRRRLLALSLATGLVALYLFAPRQPEVTFPTAARPAGFVDDTVCAECHAEIAESFARSGMGRTWRRWTEPDERQAAVVAPISIHDHSYRVRFEKGCQIQEEFRQSVDGTDWVTGQRRTEFVVGSGIKGSSYVHTEKGYYYIQPLGWYAEKGLWDLNPNYRERNQRFSRPMLAPCIGCHASAVGYHPHSGHAFEAPESDGIGCQRCHGPAEAHVTNMRSGVADAPLGLSRLTEIPDDRRQDVCLQCHLTGDLVVFQPDNDPWSFRPGMRLADVRSDFFDAQESDRFESTGHGPRSMASACYQKSGGRMTCLFCHDPHRPHTQFSSGHYNSRCLDCHARQPCTRPLSAGVSPAQGDCVNCHMPKRSSQDVAHSVATEHWISRPGATLERSNTVQSAERLTPAFPGGSDGQKGTAYVRLGMQKDDQALLELGLKLLEQATTHAPEAYDWRLALVIGHQRLGNWDKVLQYSSSELDSSGPELAQYRALALGRLDRVQEAIDVLEDSLSRWPWFHGNDLMLARLYIHQRQFEKLLQAEESFFRHHPDDPTRLELLAAALDELNRPTEQIQDALSRSIAADGAAPRAYVMRAKTWRAQGNDTAAERDLRAARALAPQDVEAGLAWIRYLYDRKRTQEARWELEALLLANPENHQVRRLLMQTNP